MNCRYFVIFEVLSLIPIAIILFGFSSTYGTILVQTDSGNRYNQTNYVNISSPVPDQNVTIGNLTIAGLSSDNSSSNCTVYVGWNDSRPFQKAIPNGSRGFEDYSKWNFTFDPTYHEIVKGTNLINSELSCIEFLPHNVTSYSLNITGVIKTNGSNVTDAGYLYPENSTAGLYDTASQGSAAGALSYDNLAYDNSTGDYSSGGYSTDSGYNNDNSGSTDGSYNSGDSSQDGSTEGTGTGSGGGTYPLVDDGVFNIGAAGDWAAGNDARETALNMYQNGVDLTLGLGDYAYSTGSAAVHDWWDNQMAPLHERFKGTLGNHDTQDQSVYAELFGQTDGWFYSFDKQGIHFVSMNSEEAFGPGSSQYKFIDQDLQSASKRPDVNWIIVFFHQPMYTSPSHHDPISSLRNAYHPLFDKYNVDLVLQGHNHNYQRSFPIEYNSKDPSHPLVTSNENSVYNDPPGEIYAEVGTGGQSSYTLDGKYSFISRQLTTTGGYLDVAFPNGQTMKGTFYDNSGSVKDEFTIQKSGTNSSKSTNNTSLSNNTTKGITSNVTEGFQALNANSSKVNWTLAKVPFPIEDNKSSHINNTDDKTVVSNASENNRTKEVFDNTFGDGVSTSQDSPIMNASLKIGDEITTDDIRNKATKSALEMAKGALDEAEQSLNNNKIANINNSEVVPRTMVTTQSDFLKATDATKDSELSVDQEAKRGPTDTVGTNDRHGTQPNYQLAQEAETEIDRAWKSLDTRFGSIVTKIESAENLKSDNGPNRNDALQILDIRSPHTELNNSKAETDNLATENKLHTSTSQSSNSKIHTKSTDIISEGSHSSRKIDLKADAGQNQKVIAGSMVTLDGTKSMIGEFAGLKYTWEQVSGPKVRIVDANSAIASFEAPNVSSGRDKITLKFVVLITGDSVSEGHISKTDSVMVIVKQDPSLGHKVELSSSDNNKDSVPSQADNNLHSNDSKDVANGDSSKHNNNGKLEERNNVESAPHSDIASPIESQQVDNDNNAAIS